MRSIRPAAVIAGLLLTFVVTAACDPSSDGSPTEPATPMPIVTAPATASVTAAPTSKPGPDVSVSSTPGPLVTATAIPISETPVAEAGRMLVLAPIENVQVVSTKSIPAQYLLTVGSGLPGGCAKYAGATVEYRDTRVIVKVYNSMPAASVPCTAIYGYTTHNVPLGALTPGVAYKIQVNDRTIDLIPQ